MSFRKGDKVFALNNGNGYVDEGNKVTIYDLWVQFENGRYKCFTEDGKVDKRDEKPVLFHGHDLKVDIEVKEPVRETYVNLYRDDDGDLSLGNECKDVEEANWALDITRTLIDTIKIK